MNGSRDEGTQADGPAAKDAAELRPQGEPDMHAPATDGEAKAPGPNESVDSTGTSGPDEPAVPSDSSGQAETTGDSPGQPPTAQAPTSASEPLVGADGPATAPPAPPPALPAPRPSPLGTPISVPIMTAKPPADSDSDSSEGVGQIEGIETVQPAPRPVEAPVGRIAVGVSFGLLLLAVVLGWPVWLQQVLLSGFIGGFTNTVAIHMLFTRVWYLPGSGVMLKRKDAIIRTLADTMEEHILNPSLIEERVRLLSQNINPDRVVDGVNAIISELRSDAIEFLQAEEQRRMITEAVRKEGGFWGDMADAVGVVTYDKVGDRIVAGLIRQLEAFRVDRTMLDAATDYAGSLESFLLEPGNPLIRRHYDSERSVAQILFEKLDARQLVIDKLSSYEAEQIRDIISENIKDHLAWLEVFGVILGMIISALVLSIGLLF